MFDKDGFIEAMNHSLPTGRTHVSYLVAHDLLGLLAASADATSTSLESFNTDFRLLASQALEKTVINPHIRAAILSAAVSGAPNFRY
jgi:hypothetical protein